MALGYGMLTLDKLNTRFEDAHVDATLSEAARYRMLKAAYSRIWYRKPWEFRKATASLSVSVEVQEYILDAKCDLVAAVFNATTKHPMIMTEGFFEYWANYNKFGSTGSPAQVADVRSTCEKTRLVFRETPTLTNGHEDVIQYYYFKHLTHGSSSGCEYEGNMGVSTDAPTFAPQFHELVVKEAILEALKNKRQFGAAYKAALLERDELQKSMGARYLTPRRYPGAVRTIR